VKINEKKGVKSAMMHSVFWQGIGFLLVGILPGIFALIGFFFVGIGLYGAMTLFNAAFGEVCDEDEVKTGTRREAAIFGTNAFITKWAESLAGIFLAAMLLLFLYQEPISGVQQTQSDYTILGIKIAMGVVPAAVSFLALLIFKSSPLEGEYLQEIKTTISKMHDEKRAKLKELRSK
jgi:Na+/melibiose symporter-like transporter